MVALPQTLNVNLTTKRGGNPVTEVMGAASCFRIFLSKSHCAAIRRAGVGRLIHFTGAGGFCTNLSANLLPTHDLPFYKTGLLTDTQHVGT